MLTSLHYIDQQFTFVSFAQGTIWLWEVRLVSSTKTRSQPTSFSSTLGKQDLMAVQGTRSWHTPDIRVYWPHIKGQWWWNTPWLLIWVREIIWSVYFINHFLEMNRNCGESPQILRKFWWWFFQTFSGEIVSPKKICWRPTFSRWKTNLLGSMHHGENWKILQEYSQEFYQHIKNIRKFSLKWLYVRNFPNPKKSDDVAKGPNPAKDFHEKDQQKWTPSIFYVFTLVGCGKKRWKRPSE